VASAGVLGLVARDIPVQRRPSRDPPLPDRQMRRAKWLWGAARIHGELLKLGIEVAQSTVAE
jgi:hypothetical protein